MGKDQFKNFKKRIIAFTQSGVKPGSEEDQTRVARREKIFVFTLAYIVALFLWFAVNLNGTFNININMPVVVGNIPASMALTDELPEFVEVSLTGTALPLISLYNNPPEIVIDVETQEVNVFDQVRQRMNAVQDVAVLKVEPLIIQVKMEEKITKRVPLRLTTDLSFEALYGLINTPVISPDSVNIVGAISQIEKVSEWVIPDTLKLSGIRDDIFETVSVPNINPLIEVSISSVDYTAQVSEFTEAEISVLIRTRDLPRGQNINYNPSTITIKYDVPIELYTEIIGSRPYEAYVPYQKILEDSSGFVTPDIELTATRYPLKIRSFQPKAVAYFSVVDQ